MKPHPSVLAQPARRIKTFIVEDNALIFERLVEMLEEDANAHVLGSAVDQTGAEAWLQSGEAFDADLLIIDIFLQQGSGLDVLEAARARGLPCKFVVLTNYATPAIRARCLALGADSVFDKSTEVDELLTYCVALQR